MNGRRLLVTPSEAVHRLSDLHGSISAAIQHANAAYGHPLLIILVSTLLHLIVTPYFLISELSSSTVRKEFTILQFIWCAVHCLRLLLVVEPCHLTIFQGRRSSVLVCRMLGYLGRLDSDPGTLQAVDIFSKQVGMRAFDFTALGVCVLDRPLVATVAGAVTTYLVILLQFKKEDKK